MRYVSVDKLQSRSSLLPALAAMLVLAPVAFTSIAHAAPDEIIVRGDQLMAAGDYQTALDTYQSKLQTDGKNVDALLGAGNAYVALRQVPKAVQMLERAYTASPKERAVVHNLALVLFKTDNQARSLKVIRDHLAANPKPSDEPLLNELLFMLDTASEATKKLKMHSDCAAFADQYAKGLEAQRPSFRRWGSEWLEAKVVADRMAANKLLEKDIEKANLWLKDTDGEIARLDKQTAGIEFRVARGFDHRFTLRTHLDQLRQLKDQREKKVQERQAVIDQLAKPATPPEPVWMATGTPVPALPKLELAARPPSAPITPPASNRPPDAPPPPTNNGKEPPAAGVQPPEEKPVAKRVTRYGVAFAISQDTLIASSDIAAGATELLVQSVQGTTDDVTVIRTDLETGLTLLRLKKLKAASLPLAAQFGGGAVQCVALPTVELFKADATLITGKASAPKEPWTVALEKNPRLPGAPLVVGNKVVGLTLADRDTDPAAVRAISLDRLARFIGQDFGTRGVATNDPAQAIFQLVATHQSK